MKGIQRLEIVSPQGQVRTMTVPHYGFLYDVATVKSEKYDLGDRVILGDGREFRYAKSAGACASGEGCAVTTLGLYGAVLGVAAVAGDLSVTVAAGTHAILAADVLRGGYIMIHNANGQTQVRGIIGNDASAENAAVKVHLDAPLIAAASTSILAEIFQNPYAAVAGGNQGVAAPKLGVPAAPVSAANKYFWVQTKGVCFVAPQSGITGKQVGACWRHDGSLDTVDNGVEDSEYVSSQYAGHRMMGSADLLGPLFNLA